MTLALRFRTKDGALEILDRHGWDIDPSWHGKTIALLHPKHSDRAIVSLHSRGYWVIDFVGQSATPEILESIETTVP